MKVKKGTVLNVWHQRSGKWIGKATADFDSVKDEWYPIILFQKEPVMGLSQAWYEGDEMPCRRSLCTFKVRG